MENITMTVDSIYQSKSGTEVQLRRNNKFIGADDRLIIANWTDVVPEIGEEYLIKLIFYNAVIQEVKEDANIRS